MLRSACFAAGLFLGLWGVAFLGIDKLVMHEPEERDPGIRGMLAKQVVGRESRPIIDPPEWAAIPLYPPTKRCSTDVPEVLPHTRSDQWRLLNGQVRPMQCSPLSFKHTGP